MPGPKGPMCVRACVRACCTLLPPPSHRSRSVAEQYSLLPADRDGGREALRQIKSEIGWKGGAEWRLQIKKRSQNRVLLKNKPQKEQRVHPPSLQNNRHLSHIPVCNLALMQYKICKVSHLIFNYIILLIWLKLFFLKVQNKKGPSIFIATLTMQTC